MIIFSLVKAISWARPVLALALFGFIGLLTMAAIWNWRQNIRPSQTFV
jgi:xanthosine utilization system XapX-like protein